MTKNNVIPIRGHIGGKNVGINGNQNVGEIIRLKGILEITQTVKYLTSSIEDYLQLNDSIPRILASGAILKLQLNEDWYEQMRYLPQSQLNVIKRHFLRGGLHIKFSHKEEKIIENEIPYYEQHPNAILSIQQLKSINLIRRIGIRIALAIR